MKNSGMTREIDELGRIVIPKEIRKKLGIVDGDPIDISLDGEKIILQRSPSVCLLCNGNAELLEFKGRRVCKKCLEELKDIG